MTTIKKKSVKLGKYLYRELKKHGVRPNFTHVMLFAKYWVLGNPELEKFPEYDPGWEDVYYPGGEVINPLRDDFSQKFMGVNLDELLRNYYKK